MEFKTGVGIESLMELLKRQTQPDPEHQKLIDTLARMTTERLDAIAGDNELAQRYVQQLYLKLQKAIAKKTSISNTTTLKVLQVLVDVHTEGNRLHKEYEKAVEEREKAANEVKSEHH